jgi:hypothetical protein
MNLEQKKGEGWHWLKSQVIRKMRERMNFPLRLIKIKKNGRGVLSEENSVGAYFTFSCPLHWISEFNNATNVHLV